MNPDALAQRRVLVVDAMSGGNDFAVALCQSLAGLCELSVFTVENTRLDAATCNARVIGAWPRFGGGTRLSTIRKLVKAIASLLQELWGHRGGTVHSQFPRFYLIEMIIYLLARPFLHKLVFTVHNAVPHERSRWREALLHVWYRLPDRIIVLSDNVRGEIVDRFGISQDRIEVIPHGNYVALRQACQGQVPGEPVAAVMRELGDDLLVLQFGIIREYKGVDTLIAAAQQLPVDRAWRVVVAGGGSPILVERYRSEIRARGLESRITILHEFLPDKDLAALIERADILVFPYRGISQSGALLMGMSFGKPCVCTDLTGFREYLRDGEGVFFDEQDAVNQLAGVLTQLLSDQSLRLRLGQAAWRAANDRYSWANVADGYLKAYVLSENLA